MQLFNLAVGVFLYRPFVKLCDAQKSQTVQFRLESLTRRLQKHEETNSPVTLTELPENLGAVAKMLTVDLELALGKNELALYYQPQVDGAGRIVGAEGLLRWDHPSFGMIYPPLMMCGDRGIAPKIRDPGV